MSDPDLIIGGDVGGTKTNVGLFEVAGGVPRLVRSASFHSPEYSGLAPILTAFLAQAPGRG